VTGKDTAGRYSLIDMYVPPAGGPPPHRHAFEESFMEEIELSGWRAYYFYFHKISGYVLAAIVGAGLSGITK